MAKDSRIVEAISVVVYTTGRWPNGRMSDNHWSFYFLIANGKGSVRMNMTAEPNDPTGNLQWSPSLPYRISNTAIRNWYYETVKRVSVKMIHALVIGNRRDQYNMSGGGSDCRYWT